MTKVHRLNKSGRERFEDFILSHTRDIPQEYPVALLDGPEVADPVEAEVYVEHRTFENRLDAARYLHRVLSGSLLHNLETDAGLWSWLALFFFPDVCARDARGRPKPGEPARWVLEAKSFRRYYRHLLAGPYRVYRAHGDNPERAMALLATPVGNPGDIVEQIASRQELVTNRGVVAAATLLYWDPATGSVKRGAAGKTNGSVRRFTDVLSQLDLNWDLYSMTAGQIISMLPREFDRFIPQHLKGQTA